MSMAVWMCALSLEVMPRLSYHTHIAVFTLWLPTKTGWSLVPEPSRRINYYCVCLYQRESVKKKEILKIKCPLSTCSHSIYLVIWMYLAVIHKCVCHSLNQRPN